MKCIFHVIIKINEDHLFAKETKIKRVKIEIFKIKDQNH